MLHETRFGEEGEEGRQQRTEEDMQATYPHRSPRKKGVKPCKSIQKQIKL